MDKVMILSVAEGDDKPLKYPLMFSKSSVLLINKVDLLPYINTSVETIRRVALDINPRLRVFVTSALKGRGIAELARYFIESRVNMIQHQHHA